MIDRVIGPLVAFSRTHALAVLAAALALGLGAGLFTATHLGMDTDATKLLSPDLPWRQREAVFDAAFPQNVGLLAIVIDGTTPEAAESATARLTERLRARPDLFQTVRRPDGGAFFDTNGLLFLSLDEVRATTEQIVQAQPLIGPLVADPSLRGLFGALSTFLEGVSLGAAPISALETPMAAIAQAAEAASKGHVEPVSWRGLFTGQSPKPQELRRFILAQPVLDFTSLTPGAQATDAVRAAARDIGIGPEQGTRVRLTGPVALSDEEFGTVAEGMGLSTILSILGVTALLFLALRSAKLILAILITLTIGLALTAGFATLAVGSLNLISVAFAVLFWGIAVDFGIQVSVAYRQTRFETGASGKALDLALKRVGGALTLAATTTAVGFLSFLPTAYRGVSELGLIAGVGMVIALALNVTVLPALLTLLKPPGEAEGVGYAALAPLDAALLRHRRAVMMAALAAGLVSAALCARLEFDFNPLNIKDRATESVATLFDLMADPTTTPNTIDVLTPSIADAAALARTLETLPEVAHAFSINTYVPEDQADKLAYIEDARSLMAPTFAPATRKAPPDDAAIVAALRDTIAMLAQPAGANAVARRLSAALTALADGPAEARARLAQALVPGLVTTLASLETALNAGPVTLADLPADLRAAWVAADGRARIEVFPAGDANDNGVLRRFVAALRAKAPEATGTPVSIQESSHTIVGAFLTAGVLALVAITVLLGVILRSVRDVAIVVAPLILAGLLTLGTCVVVGLPLNFANIIALPLLFGIGVAFNIYYVVAWRQGQDHLLQSSLTRAIVFSALSTASAFGSLALSSHPGTADMGILLTLSLAYTLVTALLVLPALLGPARAAP